MDMSFKLLDRRAPLIENPHRLLVPSTKATRRTMISWVPLSLFEDQASIVLRDELFEEASIPEPECMRPPPHVGDICDRT